jgi:hypothetical protein
MEYDRFHVNYQNREEGGSLDKSTMGKKEVHYRAFFHKVPDIKNSVISFLLFDKKFFLFPFA